MPDKSNQIKSIYSSTSTSIKKQYKTTREHTGQMAYTGFKNAHVWPVKYKIQKGKT